MADEGIKAGDAFVEVRLKLAADAWARMAADNNTAAGKAGDTLGDHIGKAIAKRIAASVKDGLTQGGVGVGSQGTRQGEDFGGKFADTAKRRIEAALRSLPKAEIGVATTEAEQKLKDLKSELSSLGSKRIGVDISEGEALAEVRRLKADLDELATKSPSIRVRVDAGVAVAELAAVDEEVRKLDGKNPKVNVDTNADKASQGVFTLFNAIALIGPAAVPSAAAAVAAILGIGVAATSVFAAIGVGKLAFQGVGGALTAIDNSQQQAAKSGATLAQQQTQLASGADSVRSAEASLANTRASAAATVRSANQQIANSEQSLADAERADLRAQKDLTTARQDAKRAIEDLNTQVADGAIQQRQAALDERKAKEALAAANTAGSTATAEQRQQAQITYDQAVQQVADLSIRQQRAIQDRDAANKAGVEGSKQVKAAQESLLSANEKVGNAEQAVTNARIAAADASRQAAFSIAQAQQSVVSSQRAMGQALVSTSVTGGAATDALRLALSKLSPEGQKFAYFLYSLKPRLDQLKQSAQAGLFPGLQAGIATLLPFFGQLDRFVSSVATELGHLGGEASHTFTDPFWRQFFGFIGDQAVPNLDLMYRSILNIAEGGARIIQAFGPVEHEVGGIILDLTRKFVAFSQGIDHNQGFQNFVKYVGAELPHVISTITALGTAGLHVIQAYAPIGSVVVSGIRLLSDIIGAIPVPVVTALATAFTAYRLSALLATGATAALNSGFVQSIAKMITFRTVTSSTLTTTTGLQRAVASAAGVIGGGLFTAALTGATIVVGLLIAKQQEAKASLEALKGALGQYGQALKSGVTAESAASAKSILEQNSALRGLVTTTAAVGISTSTLIAGLNGDRDARGQVIDALQKQIDEEKNAEKAAKTSSNLDTVASLAHHKRVDALTEMRKAFAQNNTAQAEANDLTKQLTRSENESVSALTTVSGVIHNATASADDYKIAIDAVGSVSADAGAKAEFLATMSGKVAGSQLDATGKATVFGQILQGIGDSATTSGATFDALVGTFNNIAGAALSAHDKVNLLKQAMQQAYGPAQDLNAANENLASSQASFATQIGQNNAGFDLNTALAGKNSQAIVQNRQALEAALKAAQDKFVQDLANNVSEDTARATHDKTVKSILDGIPTRQRDTQAVKDLVSEYGSIPAYRQTDVSAPGLNAAIDQLIEAHAVDYGLSQKPVWSADQIANESAYLHRVVFQGQGSSAAFKAEGGPILGPGTGTSDSIPATGPGGAQYRLSNDEHIWTAAEVRAAGGHGQVEALRKAVLEGQPTGFAAGGAVWPVAIPASPQPPVPLDELWRQWGAAQNASAAAKLGSAAPIGDPGVARTIYQVAQGLKADHKVLLSAFETALVESGMRNLKTATDHDSLGVFQQRPSQGWGTPAQVTDVAYAAHAYLTRAIANEPRYKTAGQLAQSVQRSAFPDRYDQRQAQAEAAISAVAGGGTIGNVGGAVAASLGASLHFPPWPASPAAQRGDSGVWRQVIALINSTGPVSGTFGNAYRAGDPLWHGSGRAVDWMGFNQDALATFLSGQRPLELIHRSNKRDYAYTRGVDKGSFSPALMDAHRNHVHIAMRDGGAVLAEKLGIPTTPLNIGTYDQGGYLTPGLNIADVRTRTPEAVLNNSQWDAVMTLASRGTAVPDVRVYIGNEEITRHVSVVVDQKMDAVASAVGSGVRDY